MRKVFIPKDDQRLPDYYGVKIHYVTGKVDDLQIASHTFLKEIECLEFVTHEDLWYNVPVSSIVKLEFDKSFSKIVALREEQKKKAS